MDNKEINKKIIDSQKAVFETGFNSMVMLQEQTSKALDVFLKQSPWIPVQTKSTISEWTSIYKKGTMDFKDAVDLNYEKLEEVFTSGLEKSKSKTKN